MQPLCNFQVWGHISLEFLWKRSCLSSSHCDRIRKLKSHLFHKIQSPVRYQVVGNVYSLPSSALVSLTPHRGYNLVPYARHSSHVLGCRGTADISIPGRSFCIVIKPSTSSSGARRAHAPIKLHLRYRSTPSKTSIRSWRLHHRYRVRWYHLRGPLRQV